MILNLPRLTWQASITWIENEVAESMDFEELISEFAERLSHECVLGVVVVSAQTLFGILQEIWVFPFLWWAVTQINVHSPFEKGSGNSLFYMFLWHYRHFLLLKWLEMGLRFRVQVWEPDGGLWSSSAVAHCLWLPCSWSLLMLKVKHIFVDCLSLLL